MSSPAWSELPEELLAAIAKCLNGPPDILRFRAVCKSWRSSTVLQEESSMFPAKLPFPISTNDPIHPMRRGYFTLSHTSTYLIQPLEQPAGGASCQSMLIKVKTGKRGKMHLMNPFYKESPIWFRPKTFPKVVNLLDYKVTEVCKSYCMKFQERPKNKAPPPPPLNFNPSPFIPRQEKEEADAVRVQRVVLSNSSNEKDDVIFGIYKQGSLFIMKAGDKNWTVSDDSRNVGRYQDIAIHKGKCFAIDASGKVVVLTSSLQVVEVIPSPVNTATITTAGTQKYLIESSGDLFLVHGHLNPPPPYQYYASCYGYNLETRTYYDLFEYDAAYAYHHTLEFQVFRLNERTRLWDDVKRLEDRTLFAGEDSCFSVFGQDLDGCQGNRLYYEDALHNFPRQDNMRRYSYVQGLLRHGIGACDLEDGFGVPLEDLPASFSNMLWPPPAWLRPNPISTTQETESEFVDDENLPSHPSDLSFLSL